LERRWRSEDGEGVKFEDVIYAREGGGGGEAVFAIGNT
jgi:hypothetical protein